jgi:hypothetical protein
MENPSTNSCERSGDPAGSASVVPSLKPGIPVEVRVLVHEALMSQESLRQIAAVLPQDDAELHAWLAEARERAGPAEFTYLSYAAALAGRELQATLLAERGIRLFQDDWPFAWIASHMKGDVMAALLTTTTKGISRRRSALAMVVAARWWREHRKGEAFPTKLVASGFALHTYDDLVPETRGIMRAFTAVVQDPKLTKLWAGEGAGAAREQEVWMQHVARWLDGPFAALIPEKERHELLSDRPMRRAVERIGRNEQCRCGSGKKYKRCCAAADQERLRDSSDVAGKTRAELYGEAAHVTVARLRSMGLEELNELEAAELPEELQEEFIRRLAKRESFHAAAHAFEQLGVPERLHAVWMLTLRHAARRWDTEAVERLVYARSKGEEKTDDLEPAIRLILAARDPAKFCETLEAESLRLLEAHDSTGLQDLTAALTWSPYRALGIMVARGTLLLTEPEQSAWIFNEIRSVRGDLGLPLEDETADLLDARAARTPAGESDSVIEEAQAKLEQKAAEVREVREKLAALQRELTLREKRENRTVERPQGKEHAENESARETRAKMDRLKALLQERGEERVTLRREVEKLHDELETLRSTSGGVEAGSPDAEEGGEQVQVSGQQPVRLIEFPKKFGETLGGFPQQVGRTVMQHLGRIASGDPAAFMGLTKMYECDNVLRLRVAGDYRLLLTLWPDRVQVLDVVNRRDLQARLKNLRASGG